MKDYDHGIMMIFMGVCIFIFLFRFAKNVPIDASETWDFSMQGLLKDYKSNVLWVDGPFYQKFLGECVHEMANTPCLSECKNENGEVRKIAMCRKCHVPFCSNQCFKK